MRRCTLEACVIVNGDVFIMLMVVTPLYVLMRQAVQHKPLIEILKSAKVSEPNERVIS